MTMISGIYQILNLVNDKFYIGSAVNIAIRVYEHRRLLRLSSHPNRHLQSAKYGEVSFEFRVLEIVENRSKLIECEQAWLNWTKCYNDTIGYNLAPTANSQLGFRHSCDTKEKLSVLARKDIHQKAY